MTSYEGVVDLGHKEDDLRGRPFSDLTGQQQVDLEESLTGGYSELVTLQAQAYDQLLTAQQRFERAEARLHRLHTEPLGVFGGVKIAVAERLFQVACKRLDYRNEDVKSIHRRLGLDS